MRCGLMVLCAWLVAGTVCVSAQETKSYEKPPATLAVEKQDFERTETLDGVFIPVDFQEITFWPEEYKGELLVLEALDHGMPVNEGDLIVRFDLRGIDRQIEKVEQEVHWAMLNLENLAARNAIQAEAAQAAREEAQTELELSFRNLEGWEEHERAFIRREAEMRLQTTKAYIEDQEDELAQLEAMYRDDELVDATEEIVLKRARRELARTNSAFDLQNKRDQYSMAYSEPSQRERKHLQMRSREGSMQRLVANQEIDHRERQERLQKAEKALLDLKERLGRLQHDRNMLELRAGRSGILLHGSQDDYRPGRAAPRHKRGSRLASNSTLFMIADPDVLHLALDIPESKLDTISSGLGASIKPVFDSDVDAVGLLEMEKFPTPKSAAGPENRYQAVVALERELPGFVPGMRGKAEFTIETLSDVIVLPRQAVYGKGEDAHCWVLDEESGDCSRVDLELGPEADGDVVVYGEIEEGQKVLLQAPVKS